MGTYNVCLVTSSDNFGRIKLRYNDAVKGDLKEYGILTHCTGKQLSKTDLPGEPLLLPVLLLTSKLTGKTSISSVQFTDVMEKQLNKYHSHET